MKRLNKLKIKMETLNRILNIKYNKDVNNVWSVEKETLSMISDIVRGLNELLDHKEILTGEELNGLVHRIDTLLGAVSDFKVTARIGNLIDAITTEASFLTLVDFTDYRAYTVRIIESSLHNTVENTRTINLRRDGISDYDLVEAFYKGDTAFLNGLTDTEGLLELIKINNIIKDIKARENNLTILIEEA